MSKVAGISSGTIDTIQTKKTVLGKDDFLKMLIAQLKNQDPLNPLDGSNFAAQLAQFSSLEQLSNMNTQLGTLGSNLISLNNSQLVNLVGKEVSVKGNTITVAGSTNTLLYNLPSNAQQGTIKIYDTQGTLVKTIAFGSQNAGINSMTWDCSSVKVGNYTFQVSANDSSGKDVSPSTMTNGTVAGITFKNGVPYLKVNGQDIAFGDIVSIK